MGASELCESLKPGSLYPFNPSEGCSQRYSPQHSAKMNIVGAYPEALDPRFSKVLRHTRTPGPGVD